MVPSAHPPGPPHSRPRVFCIGFHKTGTTSLGNALETLGYRVAGAFGVHEENIKETALAQAIARVPDFDAFQDNPWPVLFRELDEHFPGSRFILTVRNTKDWFRSIERHFGGRETPMRQWIYGESDPAQERERFVSVYEAHNAAVRQHFANRPADLLILDLPKGDSWPELCHFLGENIPARPFFHSNKARSRNWLLARFLRA